MNYSEITERKTRKTVIILILVAVLYTLYRYLGSADFFMIYLNRSLSFKDAQAFSQYYKWAAAFVIIGIIPALIVKIMFKEKLTDYGIFIKRPLIALFITLLGITVVTPFVYIGSKRPEFTAVYPLVRNAVDSPVLFLKSAVFYFFFYIGYEFCFRGFLFLGIKDDVGDWQALAISLLATVLLHVISPQAEMIMSIVVGIAFPIIVKKLESLWPVIFIHAYIGISFDYWVIIGNVGFYI